MKRRNFIKSAALASPVIGLSTLHLVNGDKAPNTFKLNYATHFGMFENSAGKHIVPIEIHGR